MTINGTEHLNGSPSGNAIPAKPVAPQVQPDNIPDELKVVNQWLVWRYTWDDKSAKWDKPPLCARGGSGSSTEPKTWSSFVRAMEAYKTGKYDGVGFVLTGQEQLVGVDVDKCVDKESGNISEEALSVIESFHSYAEISPSGTGIRIFLFGSLPPLGRKKGKFEIYNFGRYLTVTGNKIEGTPDTINLNQKAIDEYHGAYIARPVVKPSIPTGNVTPLNATDEELIQKMFGSVKGDSVKFLWEGNSSDHNNDTSSADLALCSHLRFWTQADENRMDSLFRQSGRMRDKWDERRGELTYGQKTIAFALPGEIYDPKPTVRITMNGKSTKNGAVPPKEPNSEAETQPDSPEEPVFTYTDIGNADRLIYQSGSDIRYSYQMKGWFIWDGTRWVLNEDGAIERLAESAVRSIAEGNPDKDALKWALRSLSNQSIKNMIERARPKCSVMLEHMDSNPWLLNCSNGTLNLKNGEWTENDPLNLITKKVNCAWRPKAECPLFESFMLKIMGNDQKLVDFWQKTIGYALTGDTREQCIFILHGVGSNGKSTFLELLSQLFGDYSINCPSDTFIQKKGDEGISNDIARLRGARFVSAIETGEEKHLNETLIKRMTGQDTITARFLHKEFFDFQPEFKVFLATNHRPVIRGTDDGIWRRIHLIPFSVRFWNPDKGETGPEELRMDKELLSKLQAELPGILSWCIRGCAKWKLEDLPVPQPIKDNTSEYRKAMDVIGDFLEEKCEVGEIFTEPVDSIYRAYCKWCEDNGESEINKKSLTQRLVERGFIPSRDKVARFWKGLHLRVIAQKDRENP